MGWVVLTAVGLLVEAIVIVALGRHVTAPYERDVLGPPPDDAPSAVRSHSPAVLAPRR